MAWSSEQQRSGSLSVRETTGGAPIIHAETVSGVVEMAVPRRSTGTYDSDIVTENSSLLLARSTGFHYNSLQKDEVGWIETRMKRETPKKSILDDRPRESDVPGFS